jgi:hypothetical protein
LPPSLAAVTVRHPAITMADINRFSLPHKPRIEAGAWQRLAPASIVSTPTVTNPKAVILVPFTTTPRCEPSQACR